MQTLDWDDYRKPPEVSASEHKTISAAAFAPQRDRIGKLCRALHPRSVVCMGAGYLNDIPLEILVAGSADFYLVEWIAGITDASFRYDLVKPAGDRFVCLACRCPEDPAKYCQNYERRNDSTSIFSRFSRTAGHCDNFVHAGGTGSVLCAKYEPGQFPRLLQADVTQGVADRFARQVSLILHEPKNPQRAMRAAVDISARPGADTPLPLPDHSVDFVTSSMLVSQFDFEPFTFFVRNLYLTFGPDVVRNTDGMGALAETLRNNLFLTQTEAHCREIARLLKPDGRAYFSIEVLHREQASERWFYAEIANKAMEVVARHFLFDLDTLPELMVPTRIDMVRGGTSVIHSYLLTPRR